MSDLKKQLEQALQAEDFVQVQRLAAEYGAEVKTKIANERDSGNRKMMFDEAAGFLRLSISVARVLHAQTAARLTTVNLASAYSPARRSLSTWQTQG